MHTWTVDSFSLCLFLRESEGNSCLLSVLCASTSLGGFSLYKYLYSTRRDGKVNKAWSLPLRRSWSCGGDRWVNLQLVLSVRGARWRDIETRLENQGFYRCLSPWHWCWLEKSRREGRLTWKGREWGRERVWTRGAWYGTSVPCSDLGNKRSSPEKSGWKVCPFRPGSPLIPITFRFTDTETDAHTETLVCSVTQQAPSLSPKGFGNFEAHKREKIECPWSSILQLFGN